MTLGEIKEILSFVDKAGLQTVRIELSGFKMKIKKRPEKLLINTEFGPGHNKPSGVASFENTKTTHDPGLIETSIIVSSNDVANPSPGSADLQPHSGEINREYPVNSDSFIEAMKMASEIESEIAGIVNKIAITDNIDKAKIEESVIYAKETDA